MESTNNNNNNNNQMFLCEFKEFRNELSAVKKRIVQLEESHEKQQEKLDVLERENHALKTQLNINGNKEGGLMLKIKKTNQVQKEVSKPASVSTSSDKKKAKTNNSNNNKDNDNEEAVVISQRDNGDSFDSLSDDLLHKIVEFDGNCYNKFGSINKRCRNIYDVQEYKLKKQTCVYGYGTLEMMLQDYLQKRIEEDGLSHDETISMARAVIWYNRLDAIDWIVQLGDIGLLKYVCVSAASDGKIKILSNMFLKLNVTFLDEILDDITLCVNAASNGQLETLKWLRNHSCFCGANAFAFARYNGHGDIVQYLRDEGCPEPSEDTNESSESEQLGSEEDVEDDDMSVSY